LRQALPLPSPRTPGAGEKIFVQCRACHQIGEAAKNAVGPVLNGLFSRKAGTVEGYSYSPANKNSGITWDEATFAVNIKGKAKAPGTKMAYVGLKNKAHLDGSKNSRG
jgi:cytochrome c